ncbi:hypothetical protein BG58_18010 [Caballeronia jiangsuensis]|nr:hypothetical protein BG58_18010 [Caballeronia jiangsuensis]
MAISVDESKKLVREYEQVEKDSLDAYLKKYKSKETSRNKDHRPDDRGCLNAKWKIEDVKDKSVLVFGENGPGDEILTLACLSEFKINCRRVQWLCQNDKLKRLFQRSFPDVDFISTSDLKAPLDGSIYSWELLERFRSTLDTFLWTSTGKFEPYLRAGSYSEGLKARYGSGQLPLVGLAWRSESHLQGKTCNLKGVPEWSNFFERLRGRARFISLQYGDTRDEIAFSRWKYGVDIYQDQDIDTYNDLDGVAAQIAALDYVVSIGTTVAHLAGALGRPGWVLLNRESFPHWDAGKHVIHWYPTLRPARQTIPGDWGRVLTFVADGLTTEMSQSAS